MSRQAKQRKPSRMVLADHVHRFPLSRRPAGHQQDDHPSGINRTTVNVDKLRRPRPRANAPDAEGKEKQRRVAGQRKVLKMHQVLAEVSGGSRALARTQALPYDSFDQFDLLPALKTAVLDEVFAGLTDITPTPVQRLAIPALLDQPGPGQPKKRNQELQTFLLAAETGSGKTLAYLLPVVDAIKEIEAADDRIKAYNQRRQIEEERQRASSHKKMKPFDEPHPTMTRPKAIVLVPTSELCEQVQKVAKSLSHVSRFKTRVLSSDLSPKQIHRSVFDPMGVDLIVSTPHLLSSIAESEPNILAQVGYLVIDEADSLMDLSFLPVTLKIVERSMPSLKQLICCSATIPRKLNHFLATNFPKMQRITTPNLHAIPRRVQLGVIDVSKEPYRNNKNLACAQAIYSICRSSSEKQATVHEGDIDVRRILVFVNERKKTEEVAEFLRSKGIDAQPLHRDSEENRHENVLDAFTTSNPLRIPAQQGHKSSGPFSLANAKVLVVTDIASRGIDTLAVRHVILYDVPHTSIDFIHRIGRAGRMGRRGRAVVLAGNSDRKDVIADVRESMFRGQALI
ncbi:hypothetical protein CDD81_7933 [Ophiocordyceps australis]|uniref:RNA helicase n=1 Tax=Ophiocordyceps australis TaxID=1399860 RepID=A0A2C5Y344_9HYPO|nr:hypothetical protein CDD81_7933 [Ophiocordyceps australis]